MNHLPNLLIVDDISLNLDLLEFVLKKLSINLIKALSGREALEKTRGMELALAIIDVRMPVMSGYELAIELNKERTGSEVPVIFLTANYFNEPDVLKGYDSGAVDYIYEPVNKKILLSKIKVFLDLYNQKQTIIRNGDALNVSRSLLKASLESQKDTILLSIDHDYRYLYFNKAHWKSMKQSYNQDVKLGMNILECITAEDDRKIAKENFDRALLGESHSNVRLYGDVELVWFESHFNPICNDHGEIIGATALARNITGRKLEEEKLKQLNEDLEDRVKQRTSELMESNAAIQRIQKNIIKAIIQTEEKERTYFSRELHDGLGPLLSTIKLYLQWFQRPKSIKSQEEIIQEALEILEDAIVTVKEISNKLSPHILISFGLPSAIQCFVSHLEKHSAARISFQSNATRRFDNEIEATLYRAIIECINNTIKHAMANNITIILNDCCDGLQLQYRDDGIGFDLTETLSEQRGIGLFNLQNRIKNIGGKITLFSQPGEGVDYRIAVKL